MIGQDCMPAPLESALSEWLQHTGNEHYSIWSPDDCEMHYCKVEPEDTTTVSKLMTCFRDIYPGILFRDGAFAIRNDIFVLFGYNPKHGTTFEVQIETFDDQIVKIANYKED